MKIKSLIILSLALSAATLSSCNNFADINQVSANSVGSSSQELQGTVIRERSVRIGASDGARGLSTLVGAAAGAVGGSYIGSGSGRTASTVGFGAAGAVAGNKLADSIAGSAGQVLSIRAEDGKTYSVTQPIYKQFGAIPVGTTGTLSIYGSGNKFLPF